MASAVKQTKYPFEVAESFGIELKITILESKVTSKINQVKLRVDALVELPYTAI